MIFRENYMRMIRPFIGKEVIKVLTGLRRSGKSVMLQLVQEELRKKGVPQSRFISYNFEDLANARLCTAEALHAEILRCKEKISGTAYLFFDEIQEVADWERCVNSLRVNSDCDIYITGSNAKLLSGELATYLAGRYVEFVIYPFSFREFTQHYGKDHPSVTVRDAFTRFLALGGMPYLGNLNYAEGPSKQYLQDVFNSVVLKDIMMRNNVRDADLLERVITYAFRNIGTTFSATSISRFFRSEQRVVAPETILNYLKYCEDAFLLYRAPRQDLRGRKVLTINEKYYVADHGLREAVYGGNIRDISLTLENIVYMELLRRGYNVTVGKVNDREIDFVCEKQKDRLYVQVAYLLAGGETIEREFRVLREMGDNFPKYVVTMDELDMSRDGIRHRNIRDFLMDDDWI